MLIHVIRCFTDINISHVDGTDKFDPVSEMENVKTELILADLDTCAKRKSKRGLSVQDNKAYSKVYDGLNNGIAVRDLDLSTDERDIISKMDLLTYKPVVYL